MPQWQPLEDRSNPKAGTDVAETVVADEVDLPDGAAVADRLLQAATTADPAPKALVRESSGLC